MFELYQLRYFAAVVDTGSFTRGSKRVGVSQPTLSAGIRKLEEIVSAQLLERSSRRVSLTRDGARFLSHTRRILAEAEAALTEVSESVPREVLRLGVLTTIPSRTVADLVAAFAEHEPLVQLALFDGSERELHARLGAGRIDVALSVERSELRARAEGLFDEGYTVAIHSGHPLARHSTLNVEELADERTIVRTRCEALASVSRFFTAHGLRPNIAYRTEQDERALSLVGAGLGITVMPEGYRAANVVQIRLNGFDKQRRICLVHPSARERKRADSAAAKLGEVAQVLFAHDGG